MIQIANKEIQVKISENGSELQSIQLNGIEYLWQADERYWSKHSPILFPIIGELKDGRYIFKDKAYFLPRHGFARDKAFEVIETDSSHALLQLKYDDETLKIYPFKFLFKVDYRLKGRALLCSFVVENIGEETMFFSAGSHPAFNVPLVEGLEYDDYELKFSNDNILKRYLLHNGLISDKTETINLDNKTLQLQPSLFYKDAIVLKHISSNQIELKTNKNVHGLKFNFEDFPCFGIWAAKDGPFVCLEPWCGIADTIHHDNLLENKEGINTLYAGGKWTRTWSVELF